jgi:hypothetical protein
MRHWIAGSSASGGPGCEGTVAKRNASFFKARYFVALLRMRAVAMSCNTLFAILTLILNAFVLTTIRTTGRMVFGRAMTRTGASRRTPTTAFAFAHQLKRCRNAVNNAFSASARGESHNTNRKPFLLDRDAFAPTHQVASGKLRDRLRWRNTLHLRSALGKRISLCP